MKSSHFVRIVIALALALGSTALYAQTTRTWNGGGGDDNWSTSGNWGGTAPTGGESLVFGGWLRGTNVNDITADTTFSNLTFSSGAGLFRLTGNRIALVGTVLNSTTNTQKITLPVVLSGTRTFNASGTGYLAVDGTMSGAGGISKTGANTLVLQGSNSYDGVTSVDDGVLRISNAFALGSTNAGTTVANGKRLELDSGVTVSGETVTIVGSGGNYNGALQVYNGVCTWAGNIVIGDATARIGCSGASGSARLIVSGVIDDGPNTYNLFVRNGDNPPIICGSTTLTGVSTYGGDSQIIVGMLKIDGGDNRLPTNSLLRVGNGSNTAYALFDLNGRSQQVGGVTNDGTSMPMTITNGLATASTLTVNNSISNTFTGNIGGNLSLTKLGSGNLTLSSGNNGFSGDTRIVGGTLTLGNALALKGSTLDADYSAAGSLLFGTQTSATLGGLKGSNSLAMANNAGAGITLTIGINNGSSVYSGQLSGGTLVKTGTGNFVMTGANTYTGRTAVIGGKLGIASEPLLGTEPGTLVTNQLAFDGGTLMVTNSFRLGPSNRGIAMSAGGGTFEVNNENSTLAISNVISGTGGPTKNGVGLLTLTAANTYDGTVTVNTGVLRIFNNAALGSTVNGTLVNTGSQLELANGLKVSGEKIRINGLGLQAPPKPPTSPDDSRGALQAAVGATAEWAGPVILGSTEARVGAQGGGHLIVSGVVSDEGNNYTFRTSSDPNNRTKGVILTSTNAYGGRTEVTRGTLFLGTTNALPVVSVLNIHWAGTNPGEYAALDLNGFDQTVGGLMNTGFSGGFAVLTNSSATAATLTVNQAANTEFNGVLAGKFAFVKDGSGTLTLSNRNSYAGTTTVRGGTLRQGVSGFLPSSNAVVLAGGTLDMASFTNTLASLTVTADSTLILGSGKLTFNSQSAADWSGLLDLAGIVDVTALRFLPALSAEQIGLIRNDGKRVTQNASGYIIPIRGTIIRVN